MRSEYLWTSRDFLIIIRFVIIFPAFLWRHCLIFNAHDANDAI